MLGLVELNATFIFQIINFLIIYFVLKRFLFGPITEMMDKRTKGIQDSIAEAENRNKEAMELKAEYENKINEIKKERNLIIEEASRKAEERGNEIIKAAEVEAEKIKERGRQEIMRERQKAANELKEQISTMAIMAASKVIEKELNQQAHEKMIEKFIEEVGEAQWLN